MDRSEEPESFNEEMVRAVEVWAEKRELGSNEKDVALGNVRANEEMLKFVRETYGHGAVFMLLSRFDLVGDPVSGQYRIADGRLNGRERPYSLGDNFVLEDHLVEEYDVDIPLAPEDSMDYELKVISKAEAPDEPVVKDDREELAQSLREELEAIRATERRYVECLADKLKNKLKNEVRAMMKKRSGIFRKMRRAISRERRAVSGRMKGLKTDLASSVRGSVADLNFKERDLVRRVNYAGKFSVGLPGSYLKGVKTADHVLDMPAWGMEKGREGVSFRRDVPQEIIEISDEYDPGKNYSYHGKFVPESVVVTRILEAHVHSDGLVSRGVKLVTPLVKSPGIVERVWRKHGLEIKDYRETRSVPHADWYRDVLDPWVKENVKIKEHYQRKR